ncbi:sugar phosphate nucleotidyltransferase [Zunongwangia sp. F363]|uniref:Sugar phosphate nucleotidyltransferase n=1 Tax=Autumnicola tepida TaxID=3075595 RepID=A0ABU3C7I1_9FLAO|nr:sugar phosphate nucleotidyltransferase [Zunongwangia sp. F363]MDT0642300.1 sugar phosphate nucleotidyltransferase [Zunongwangia sp. F363]
MSSVIHVLLTGGVGSRLWPLSRHSRPKQYLNIFSENTAGAGAEKHGQSRNLFELAIERNAALSDRLMVVGNQGNRQLSEDSLYKLKLTDYTDVVEAAPRNTAAAIAFAAFASAKEDVLLVTPADHIIKDGPGYSGAIKEAIKLAHRDVLVTFGVAPNRPESGYGYIEHKGQDVISFREKPSVETARDFLRQGNFLWNSGMFCFKAGVFLEELKELSPVLFEKAKLAWQQNKEGKLPLEASMEIPSVSVDYAVMEKSDKIKVIKAEFEWSDMGSFEAVYDYLKEQGHPVDVNGNMVLGSDRHTAFVGLGNCILVSTKDAQLVLSKAESQKVKDVYVELEKNSPDLIH